MYVYTHADIYVCTFYFYRDADLISRRICTEIYAKQGCLNGNPCEGGTENEPDSVTQASQGNNKSRITIGNREENSAWSTSFRFYLFFFPVSHIDTGQHRQVQRNRKVMEVYLQQLLIFLVKFMSRYALARASACWLV